MLKFSGTKLPQPHGIAVEFSNSHAAVNKSNHHIAAAAEKLSQLPEDARKSRVTAPTTLMCRPGMSLFQIKNLPNLMDMKRNQAGLAGTKWHPDIRF